jgi:hypothetical protein
MIRTMEVGAAQSSFLAAIASYTGRLKSNVPGLLAAKRNIFGSAADEELPAGKACLGCKTLIPTRLRYCPKCAVVRRRSSNRSAQQALRIRVSI